MEPILKQSLCKFLTLIRDRVDLFDLNKLIDKQIISLEPDDLIEEGIGREYLPAIIEYLKTKKIVKEEITLTDSQYNDSKIQDPFMYEGIDQYSKYNIILNNNFYKNYKLTKDELKCDEEIDIKSAEKPTYDKTKKILNFLGKDIDFTNSQNQSGLLEVIFEDINKKWHFDDIQDKWDPNYAILELTKEQKEKDKIKFYSAVENTNKTIAINTSCKDLLLVKNKMITINPKYL